MTTSRRASGTPSLWATRTCAASTSTTSSNAGSMPPGEWSSRLATPRTQISRDSPGPSTWSRSASSTTPTLGGRCRCRALLVPCPSANVREGRATTAKASTRSDPIDIKPVRPPVDNDCAVDHQPGAPVELPPPPLPGVWPKRLWILVLVTAVVAPLLVWLFIKALGYRGGGDFGGMGAMSAVLNALPLLAAWVVAIVSRLRRSLVQRRYT
jgi:hypothetical protein